MDILLDVVLKYCKRCYLDGDGMCSQCCELYNICPNCIAYGDGGLCLNCLPDEGVDLGYTMSLVHEWIVRNNYWFETESREAHDEEVSERLLATKEGFLDIGQD